MPLALLGLPSVEEVVRKVAHALFSALSQALLPDFLRDASVDAIGWLIALPNPADAALWPNVARLEGNMEALAFGLLGLTLTASAVRFTLSGFGGGGAPHPLSAVGQTAAAAAALVVYHWAFSTAVGFVNAMTEQILAWPVVAHGLGRTVKVLFGGSLLIGSGSAFLALLALAAIFLAATLFLMKVALLMAAAILYVAGPPLVAVWPVPPLARFARLWLFAAIAVALIPVGWCIIFATAGAISLDVTSFRGIGSHGASQVVATKTTGAFAGLLTFAIAAWFPVKLLKLVAGFASTGAAASAAPVRAGATGSVSSRVQQAQARLRSGVLTGGAALGAAAGALGAPRRGAAGALARNTRRLTSAGGRAAGGHPTIAGAKAAANGPLRRAGIRLRATGIGRRVGERLDRVRADVAAVSAARRSARRSERNGTRGRYRASQRRSGDAPRRAARSQPPRRAVRPLTETPRANEHRARTAGPGAGARAGIDRASRRRRKPRPADAVPAAKGRAPADRPGRKEVDAPRRPAAPRPRRDADTG